VGRHWERTGAGKLWISVLVVAIVAVVVLGSFRPSLVGRQLQAVGFPQSWGVFAPDPEHREVAFDAVVTFADGSQATWRIPRASAAFPYPSHRWELWQERIVSDDYSAWWERTARWIAGRQTAPGRDPVRVVLRRRWSDLPPPGFDPKLRQWNDFEFYSLNLR
jgi:hypothetical protein